MLCIAHRHRGAQRNHAGGKARGHGIRPTAPRPVKCTSWSRLWCGHRARGCPLRSLTATCGGISARHHRRGRHLALRHRLLALRCAWPATDGRSHHAVPEAQVQPADRERTAEAIKIEVGWGLPRSTSPFHSGDSRGATSSRGVAPHHHHRRQRDSRVAGG